MIRSGGVSVSETVSICFNFFYYLLICLMKRAIETLDAVYFDRIIKLIDQYILFYWKTLFFTFGYFILGMTIRLPPLLKVAELIISKPVQQHNLVV